MARENAESSYAAIKRALEARQEGTESAYQITKTALKTNDSNDWKRAQWALILTILDTVRATAYALPGNRESIFTGGLTDSLTEIKRESEKRWAKKKFPPEEKFYDLCCAIACNITKNERRKDQQKELPLLGEHQDTSAAGEEPVQYQIEEEELEIAQRMTVFMYNSIKPLKRLAFFLHVEAKLSYVTIGKMLEVGHETARRYSNEVSDQLRRRFGEHPNRLLAQTESRSKAG